MSASGTVSVVYLSLQGPNGPLEGCALRLVFKFRAYNVLSLDDVGLGSLAHVYRAKGRVRMHVKACASLKYIRVSSKATCSETSLLTGKVIVGMCASKGKYPYRKLLRSTWRTGLPAKLSVIHSAINAMRLTWSPASQPEAAQC